MSELKPHEQRVVAEFTELRERHGKLSAFIASDTFTGLPEEDRELLVIQENLMDSLSFVLARRIKRFTLGVPACGNCKGTGKQLGAPCARCNGTGRDKHDPWCVGGEKDGICNCGADGVGNTSTRTGERPWLTASKTSPSHAAKAPERKAACAPPLRSPPHPLTMAWRCAVADAVALTTKTQEAADRFYMEHGPCCAGCDWWSHIGSLIGECRKSAPVSAEERYSVVRMEWTSYRLREREAGHILTNRGSPDSRVERGMTMHFQKTEFHVERTKP